MDIYSIVLCKNAFLSHRTPVYLTWRSCPHILIKQYCNLNCGQLSSGIVIVPLSPQTIAVSKFQVRTMELFSRWRIVSLLISYRLHVIEERLVFLNTYVTIFSALAFILFYAYKAIRFSSSIQRDGSTTQQIRQLSLLQLHARGSRGSEGRIQFRARKIHERPNNRQEQ